MLGMHAQTGGGDRERGNKKLQIKRDRKVGERKENNITVIS